MGPISNSIGVYVLLNTYYGLMFWDIQISKAQTTPVLKIYIMDICWGRGKIRQIHQITEGRIKNGALGFQTIRSCSFLSLQAERKTKEILWMR